MDQKIKDKIQKLLNLANGNAAGGEHERDTAMKMALKLLAKHNLDMANFVQDQKQEDRVSVQDTQYAYPWMRTVANALAEMYFCKFFSTAIPQYKRIYTFVGKESNVEMAKEMTRYVIKSIQREAARERKARNEREPFENSFLNAAGVTLANRCYAIKQEEINGQEREAEEARKGAPQTGTALVLSTVYKEEESKNALFIVEKMGVKLKMGKSNMRSTSNDGRAAGAAYAKTINLGRQLK